MIAGAAIAYGLTTGGAFAPEIAITPLGMRVVRPTTPGDDTAARRQALLLPKIVGDFLRAYDGAALPPEQIGKNVLLERGVPAERVDDVLALILEGAASVDFLKDINGRKYIDLGGASSATLDATPASEIAAASTAAPRIGTVGQGSAERTTAVSLSPGVNINLQIHIAADATAATIEEIFKNMRKYVLGGSNGEIE